MSDMSVAGNREDPNCHGGPSIRPIDQSPKGKDDSSLILEASEKFIGNKKKRKTICKIIHIMISINENFPMKTNKNSKLLRK